MIKFYWYMAIILSLAINTYGQSDRIQAPQPQKEFKVGDNIQLPDAIKVTVAVYPASRWTNLVTSDTVLALELKFSGKSTGILTFPLGDMVLLIGERSISPWAIEVGMGNDIPLSNPRFVKQGGWWGSLGTTVRQDKLLQDGMVFVGKENKLHFLGHTEAPLYLVFKAPPADLDHPAVLSMSFVLNKQPFSARIKIK